MRADGSLLARVLGNLINNACVHNPGGVTVRLTCKRTESEAVIAVADDGAGIPESIRDHVFEPFVTSNDARESGKGTGLGLSIAKRFIDLQGGTIAVSAQPEEDFETEIVVTLPLA
ncbi:sensor histidine kinase [Eggerthella lenta]|uniref:sensor histidine kinase n=1 Tax=Eggerthella lenta TaxID=84112 RepID=UPI002B4B9ACA|nr:ATP-binding protein [Eggerthella lenta]